MALMKTGRKMSMPNGEDPKKPKAQAEVKVTAKRPAAEPPQKKYTWDDVSRNIDIQERNKAKKAQYESDVASYNKAMKLYREGPGTPSNVGQKLATGKLRGGETASFEQADYLPAEKSNKMLREQLKRGELVSVDDPSLDPTTRKLLRGTMLGSMGEGQTDILGTGGKIYVPKGTKFDNYAQIYGEDFNPEEFVAAGRSGKFDEYIKKKGYTDRAFAPNISFYQEYKEPTAPKGPEYEKEEAIDRTKLPVSKLPTLKKGETFEGIGTAKNVGKIVKKDYGKLATYKAPAPEEKADWEDPAGGVRTKSRYVKPYQVKTGKYVKENIKYGLSKMGGDTPILRPGVLKTREALIQGKSGREAKMAKAYFSGFEGKGAADIAETKASLKADKASLKEGIKEIRRGKASPSTLDKSERIAGLRAAKKDVKAEIKQAKQASKYLGKLGKEFVGVYEGEKLRRTGKIKYYTPEAMKGFAGSKQDTFDPEANFKSQLNNPANRNTIPKQMETVDPRRSRAQRKEEQNLQREVERKMGI